MVEWPHFTTANFSAATSGGDMHALLNSLYISTTAATVSTVPATLAAYAFSRHHIPWKGPMLLFILMLAGVPISIIIVPVYQEFANLGYLSSFPTAIFLGVISLPFEIWIIKNFIDAVPAELEEAARLEEICDASRVAGTRYDPVALFGYFGSATIRYGDVAAYSIVYSLPVVILYIGMSRLFRGGYRLGGAIHG